LTDPQSLSQGVRTPVSWVVDGAVALLLLATLVMLYLEGAGI
jgi:hypothetical protein